MKLMTIAALGVLLATLASGERAWTTGTVATIEHKANWGMDRPATLYRIDVAGVTLTLADLPQTVWSAAPKPRCEVGSTVGVEKPKPDGRWKSRVRIKFGREEKNLYFDSQSTPKSREKD